MKSREDLLKLLVKYGVTIDKEFIFALDEIIEDICSDYAYDQHTP